MISFNKNLLGKPRAGNSHAGFDEARVGETERWKWLLGHEAGNGRNRQATAYNFTAPILDPTAWPISAETAMKEKDSIRILGKPVKISWAVEYETD